MASQDMLNFVTQDEPEIVDAIEAQSHGDNWRRFIEPKARSVDPCAGERLDQHISNAVISQKSWHLAGLGRSLEKCLNQLHRAPARTWRVWRNNHLARDLPSAIEPCQLGWTRLRCYMRPFCCMREELNLFETVGAEKPDQLRLDRLYVPYTLRFDPAALDHRRNRQMSKQLCPVSTVGVRASRTAC